jgi:hypothetical protein
MRDQSFTLILFRVAHCVRNGRKINILRFDSAWPVRFHLISMHWIWTYIDPYKTICMKVKCECSALNAVNTSQKREHAVVGSENNFLYHGNGQQVIILIRSKRTSRFINTVKLYTVRLQNWLLRVLANSVTRDWNCEVLCRISVDKQYEGCPKTFAEWGNFYSPLLLNWKKKLV